ncbi:MAG: hypothetical protein OXN93_08695 [bacterium]|nr:hypothetical protein [bacterium]
MIREGGTVVIENANATEELLDGTQFSTITQAMDFVVRLVATAQTGTYVFRRGSDRLSQGSLSLVANGIANAEDAEIFRGRIMPGNLYLDVTSTNDATVVQFDITAY